MTAVYQGRWINAKGEEGPWSCSAMIQIAFGGSALEAIDRAREILLVHEQRRAA